MPDLVERRAEQVGESRERERRLRLDAPGGEHLTKAILRLLDTGLPEGRLADPRLAVEDERYGSIPHPREECTDGVELLLPTDDAPFGHFARIVTGGERERERRRGSKRTPNLPCNTLLQGPRSDGRLLWSLQSRIVTTPELASTRRRSPVLMSFVPVPVPITAGNPYSRATIAAWHMIPPESSTAAAIRS